MKTAKELFDKMLSDNDEVTSTEMMIEFAKMHVQAALDAAWEVEFNNLEEFMNCYPLTNIK